MRSTHTVKASDPNADTLVSCDSGTAGASRRPTESHACARTRIEIRVRESSSTFAELSEDAIAIERVADDIAVLTDASWRAQKRLRALFCAAR
jgi:hypothetical protein